MSETPSYWGTEIQNKNILPNESIPGVITKPTEMITSVKTATVWETVSTKTQTWETVVTSLNPWTVVVTEKQTSVVDTKSVSTAEAKVLVWNNDLWSKTVVSSVLVAGENVTTQNLASQTTQVTESWSKLAKEQNVVLANTASDLSALKADTQKAKEAAESWVIQPWLIIPVWLTNWVSTTSTPVIDIKQAEVLWQLISEAPLQDNQVEASVVVKKTPIVIEEIVEEKVIVDVNVNKLSFKWTRFEKREDVLKYGSNYIFDDEKWKQLLEEISRVMDTPTKEEEIIVTWILNNYKTFFDKKKLEEKKIYWASKLETSKLNENINIAQEIIEKSSDIVDNKMVETRRTKTTKTVYWETRIYQKLNKVNPQTLAAKALLWEMSRWFESKIVEFYKTISLERLLQLYNKTQNSSNKEDVFNAEIDALIWKEVLEKLVRFQPRNWNKSKYEEFKDIIIKQKKMIAQTYFKQSTFFVSSFIQDTQKWKDYFNWLKDTKENETVTNLIWNPDFNYFSVRLNQELAWIRKKRSTLQLQQDFAQDAWLALLWRVINDKKNATSIETPWIITWGWLYEKKLELKRWVTWKDKELFLWWQKFNFDWIKNIKDIVIFWDNVIVTWEIYGSQTDIKIKKQEFITWIQNLILKWEHKFKSEDWISEFDVKKP